MVGDDLKSDLKPFLHRNFSQIVFLDHRSDGKSGGWVVHPQSFLDEAIKVSALL
jgi:hypothetical protein